MKIEVGKKYVNSDGLIVEIVSKLPGKDNTIHEYLGYYLNRMGHYEASAFRDDGSSVYGFFLVKEHKEKKILAPALLGGAYITNHLYVSQKEANAINNPSIQSVVWLGNHPGYAMYEDGTPIE